MLVYYVHDIIVIIIVNEKKVIDNCSILKWPAFT